MPALSPTMTSGNIGAWQKNPGDTLAPGDVLVEIETDKAQMDFEFQEEGIIAKILKDAGEKDVPVGNVSDYFFFLGLGFCFFSVKEHHELLASNPGIQHHQSALLQDVPEGVLSVAASQIINCSCEVLPSNARPYCRYCTWHHIGRHQAS